MYVADGSLGLGNNRIQKFDSNGKFITKWGSKGTGDGQFITPNWTNYHGLSSLQLAIEKVEITTTIILVLYKL